MPRGGPGRGLIQIVTTEVQLSNRRVMKKIGVGKARPAIFYQFDTLVELSDGSVIKRRSQAPKDEIRMIADQRNSVLWNPNRSNLKSAASFATGKISQFNERYGGYDDQDTPETKKQKDLELLELMGEGAKEIKGGKLYSKKEARQRFKN